MTPSELNNIHPDLDTTANSPTLVNYLGFGTRLYGKRDFDSRSQSFVKTLFLTVLFIPIFALSAYRVARSERGLVLLGRVPVSPTARKASIASSVTLVLFITSASLYSYLTSERYLNRQRFVAAQEAMEKGEFVQAIRTFKQLMVANTEFTQQSSDIVRNVLNEPKLSQIPREQLVAVIEVARSIPRSYLKTDGEKLFSETLAIIQRIKQESPTVAHSALHSIEGLSKSTDIATLDEELLNASVQMDSSISNVNELAVLLEKRGDAEALRKLLLPRESGLEDGEGARILAQLLTGEGEFERAYPLFSAYLEKRLKTLSVFEKQYFDLQKSLWDNEFKRLNDGKGPANFYKKYEQTPEAEKQAFVNEYVAEAVNNNTKLKAALDQYRTATTIVPAALDYGVVLLQRAQGMPDESVREAELKRAESTFLAVRGVAGDSDQYRLYLGQVYYWLGKHNEGHAEFDALLAKYERKAETLLGVANTLRDIGMNAEATALATEAYNGDADKEFKHAAAHLLFLLSSSLKERISWLEKSDASRTNVAMDLADSRGQVAEQEGDLVRAAKHYREAIQISEGLAVNATTYNNTALVYSSLARVTQDLGALEKGALLMSKAVELNPGDAILLSNAAEYLFDTGLREIYANRVDFATLHLAPDLDDLHYLYQDSTGLEKIRDQIRQQPLIKQGIEYLRKSVLLAPKEARNYFRLYRFAAFTEETSLLRELDTQLARNAVDLTVSNKRFIDFLANRNQDEIVKAESQQVRRYTELSSKGSSPLTRAMAFTKLAEIHLQQIQRGSRTTIADSQAAAERAYELSPSVATQDMVINVLITRASLEAADVNADYRAVRNSAGRGLPDDTLAALAMQRPGDMHQTLIAHPIMKRGLVLLGEQLTSFPKKTNLTHWALLTAHAPEKAEQIAANVRSSEVAQLERRIAEQLYPLHPYVAVSAKWISQIENKSVDLTPLLARFTQHEIPVPTALLN